MPDVVRQFLAGIGLGLLEDTFAEHDIDGVTLFELDENDLKEMGMRLCGNQPVRRVHPTILH